LLLIGVLSERVIGYVLTLSKAFGLSEMAAGFILLSVTTSLPIDRSRRVMMSGR